MSLPYELTTIPPQALEVLRFLGRANVDTADADELTAGANLSEKGFSKAIKRLVTKGYLTMGEARTYHLTPKGFKAIEDIQEYDINAPQNIQIAQDSITYDLCAVIPSTIAAQQKISIQVGLEPQGIEIPAQETQLVLRFEVVDGEVSPREAVVAVSSSQSMAHTSVELKPNPNKSQLRFRIEAFQLNDIDGLEVAGGMYIDIPIGSTASEVKAFHTAIALIEMN